MSFFVPMESVRKISAFRISFPPGADSEWHVTLFISFCAKSSDLKSKFALALDDDIQKR